MKRISQFRFRLSPTNLLVLAGVLNNTVESLEDTKVVREVTDVFLHEEFDYESFTNDIAIIRVRLHFKYEKQIFYILVGREHICYKVQSEIIIQIKQLKSSRPYFAHVYVLMDNEHILHFLHCTVKCS